MLAQAKFGSSPFSAWFRIRAPQVAEPAAAPHTADVQVGPHTAASTSGGGLAGGGDGEGGEGGAGGEGGNAGGRPGGGGAHGAQFGKPHAMMAHASCTGEVFARLMILAPHVDVVAAASQTAVVHAGPQSVLEVISLELRLYLHRLNCSCRRALHL